MTPPPRFDVTLASDELDIEATKQAVIEALRTVYDPEIPVSLYDLGLIYDIIIAPTGKVDIVMTLTAPGCPVADILPMEVEKAARSVDGVTSARVELVFDPPWRPDMMSEAARLELGMF
jgi:FeS assembly SUF system protein